MEEIGNYLNENSMCSEIGLRTQQQCNLTLSKSVFCVGFILGTHIPSEVSVIIKAIIIKLKFLVKSENIHF